MTLENLTTCGKTVNVFMFSRLFHVSSCTKEPRLLSLYGKVFACTRFSNRPSDEGARSVGKNRRKILSRTDRANEVNKEFIIWLLVHFLLKFATLFLSSEFAVTLSC